MVVVLPVPTQAAGADETAARSDETAAALVLVPVSVLVPVLVLVPVPVVLVLVLVLMIATDRRHAVTGWRHRLIAQRRFPSKHIWIIIANKA